MTPSQAASDSPRLSLDGHVARIVLERPSRHNAIEAVDVDVLRTHLDTVDADEGIRTLVVTGSGDSTFCAGASLRQMESGEMSGAIFEAFADRLAAVRVPTICALNGSAFGGGTELALCCDFRIGVTGSRMGVPAGRLGICYPLGGLRRFVERLGLNTAQRLLMAGEELDAEEMLRVGFLTDLVAPEDLEDATQALATRLAGLAPLAVQAMKRIVGDIARGSVDEDLTRELIERCTASADLQEGLRAHRAGEEPRFEGR